MRKALTLAAAATVLAGLAASAPAHAADTTLSVVVDAGALGIAVSTAGTTVTLAQSGVASILPGAAVTGSLGSTEVNDTRGSSKGWTAYISATDFVSGTDTITIDNASVSVGALANLSLPSVCGVGGTVTFPLSAQTLTTEPAQLATCAGALGATIGTNSAKWGSTVSLTIPSTAPSGTYTSTVTQSVQ